MNTKALGLTEICGGASFPERVTRCGEVARLSTNTSAALRTPGALGTRYTVKLQLAFGTRTDGQFVDITKSVALAPSNRMLEMLSGAVPGLEIVIVCPEVLLPTAWAAKVKLLGLNEICATAPAAPVPLRGIT